MLNATLARAIYRSVSQTTPAGPARYRRHPLTAGRIVDGLAFVITAEDNKLHTLNGAATQLWEVASSADGCTAPEAAARLIRLYEVDEATALRDAVACLEDLVARQILVAVDAGA